MNLRQKNKKLKQELERLENQTVPYKVNVMQRSYIPIRCLRSYNQFEYGMCDLGVVKRSMCQDLAKEIMPHVLFEQRFDPDSGRYLISAEVNVVYEERRIE